MRVRTIAVASLLGMSAWAAAQDVADDSRQSIGREAYVLLSSFYDYDRDIPLEERTAGKFEIPGATVEKVVFRSRDSHVVAFLAVPKGGSKPYPCVLALHGLGLDKMSWWEDDNDLSGGNLTKALLDAGIAVLTPDAQYHGERSHSNDYEFTHTLRLNGREFRFRDMLIQSVVDCRRAIDFLATRSDIDESKIGVIGYSLGGIETFALTALDKRVKVAVACVTPIGYLDRMKFSPAVLPQTFAHEVKDRPFLMLMGRDDDMSATEADARRVYELIPGSSKKLMFFDSGHVLPIEYVSHAVKWLADGLQ